jgi:glutamate carboxypeptidase
LLHGHVDTVHPIGTASSHLVPRIEGHKLYGPGVLDMKAGVLMAYKELMHFVTHPELYSLPLTLMIVPDEEHGSLFSRPFTEKFALENYCALVFEPGHPECGIIESRKGYSEFRVSTSGRAARAGLRPHDGQSAIIELCNQVLVLEALTDDQNGIACNVGKISGGTFVNVVPDHASARVEIRFDRDHQWPGLYQTLQNLRSHNPKIKIQTELIVHQPAMPRELTLKMVQHIVNAGRSIGLKPYGVPTGGSSDANLIAGVGCPAIDGMGPEGYGSHAHDEHILVSSYNTKANLLRTFLQTALELDIRKLKSS